MNFYNVLSALLFLTALVACQPVAQNLEPAMQNTPTVYDNHADLQAALNKANPGDVIAFTGTIDGTLTTKQNGTEARPITLRGVGEAIIDGPGGPSDGFGIICSHDWYIFEDFTILNTRKGFVAQNGAENGIIRRVTIDTVGNEAFKFRWNSRYWLVENCLARNTGLHSNTYGEGYYVGNADNNWIDADTPDASSHITFLNCRAEALVNDGFDVKEGASHVKIIGCTVDFTKGQPDPAAPMGDSGIYLRAENIQVINSEVIGQSNGGAAVKLARENQATDGKAYGSNYEIYGLRIRQSGGGSAMLNVHNEAAIRDSTILYKNYDLTGGVLYVDASTQAVSRPARDFTELTWPGPGGDAYLK